MQGMRLAEDVKDVDPSVRVLLMSGLEPEGISKRVGGSRVTPDGVLAKPFSPEDFTSKIQALME
jgi:DNA-binding response OmpR family regulator